MERYSTINFEILGAFIRDSIFCWTASSEVDSHHHNLCPNTALQSDRRKVVLAISAMFSSINLKLQALTVGPSVTHGWGAFSVHGSSTARQCLELNTKEISKSKSINAAAY